MRCPCSSSTEPETWPVGAFGVAQPPSRRIKGSARAVVARRENGWGDFNDDRKYVSVMKSRKRRMIIAQPFRAGEKGVGSKSPIRDDRNVLSSLTGLDTPRDFVPGNKLPDYFHRRHFQSERPFFGTSGGAERSLLNFRFRVPPFVVLSRLTFFRSGFEIRHGPEVAR